MRNSISPIEGIDMIEINVRIRKKNPNLLAIQEVEEKLSEAKKLFLEALGRKICNEMRVGSGLPMILSSEMKTEDVCSISIESAITSDDFMPDFGKILHFENSKGYITHSFLMEGDSTFADMYGGLIELNSIKDKFNINEEEAKDVRDYLSRLFEQKKELFQI